MASKSRKKLIADLDREFSQYTRLSYADENGYNKCYTCGRRAHYKEMQCGHFMPRSLMATRWNGNNARPQCGVCNSSANGRRDTFRRNLISEIGIEAVENIEVESKQMALFGFHDLQHRLEVLRDLIKWKRQKVNEQRTV